MANETDDEVEALARAAEGLGQEVVAREVRVSEVARVAEEAAVDLAFVGLPGGESAEHALAMIGQLARRGVCPVVAVTDDGDPEFAADAAKLGVYAHTTRLEPTLLRGAIDVALRRFQDYAELKLVAERRTHIERAKGIMMERYDLDEHAAFVMLRRHARASNLRLGDAAGRVLAGHRLLPREQAHPGARHPEH